MPNSFVVIDPSPSLSNKEKVYNRYITPEYAEKFDFIVFCHDDVFIDDGMEISKIQKEDHYYDIT